MATFLKSLWSCKPMRNYFILLSQADGKIKQGEKSHDFILVNQIKQLLYVSLWISLLFLRGCIFSQTESFYGCVTRRERKVISPWEGVAGTPRPFPIPAFEMSKDPKTDDTYPVLLPFPELGLKQLVVLALLWQRDSAKIGAMVAPQCQNAFAKQHVEEM